MSDNFTCGKCGEEMRYNVPRLGPNGGFVHARTGGLLCAPPTIANLSDDQKNALLLISKGWWFDEPSKEWCLHEIDGVLHTDDPPDYIHDERAAITLCDMLKSRGYRAILSNDFTPDDWWQCIFTDGATHIGEGQFYTSIATAISHAALLALNLATK